MKIYQQSILSDEMNFATNEFHHKCDFATLFKTKINFKKTQQTYQSLESKSQEKFTCPQP